MKKRLLSILLMICMVFTMLPAKVFAADTLYDIWVADVQVTSANAGNITGGGITGTVTYDAATNTLTLNNATITGWHYLSNGYTGIYSESSLSIVLVGTNTIDISITNTVKNEIYGLVSHAGDLTLSGSGSLTVKMGIANQQSIAIAANLGNITITDCSLEAIAGISGYYSNKYSAGIIGNKITLKNATVTAIGLTDTGTSYGIKPGYFAPWGKYDLILENSTLTAMGRTNALGIEFTQTGVTAIASTDMSGSSPVPYIRYFNSSYKWFKAVAEPTYPVTITVNKDGTAWNSNGKNFKLVKGGISYSDLTAIPNGDYDIYDGTTDTGANVTVNGAAASATLDYYTVNLSNGEGVTSTSGAGTYPKGSSPIISAEVTSGYNFSKWTQTATGTDLSTMKSYTITNIQSAQSYTAMATKIVPVIGEIPSQPDIKTGSNFLNNILVKPTITNNGFSILSQGWQMSTNGSTDWTDISSNTKGTAMMNGYYLRYYISYRPSLYESTTRVFSPNTVQLSIERYTPSLTLTVKPASPQFSGTTITLWAYISGFAPSVTDQSYFSTVPVTFKDGSTILGTATISASNHTATFTTSTLAVGDHNFTANFAGDSAYNAPATSSVVNYVVTTDSDIAIIAAAKSAAQNASYLDMTQAKATGEAAIVDTIKATAETAVNNSSVTVTINKVSYTAPIAGTNGNPGGTDGSYVFTITVSKGSQSQTTEQKTISIAATAYTGITDEQAVAAAKAALVDGSTNVAFGADQSTKTAAVQTYVKGILDSTADAAGVSAVVTYNSTTGKYEVAITKGSASDAKSLTMTLNETSDPDIAIIAAAKYAAQNAGYLDMTQATATGEATIVNSLKEAAETAVNNSSVTVTINNVSYTAPIAGTDGNPSGTDGSYVFTITVSKGSQSQTTEQKTIGITATAYTGITDEQAVAAAKAALVDGSANVAIGADQTAKTAVVQAYVNGILSGTADAAGVYATVTYNSTTGKYEVAITKGSVSDTKSLTMTLNETTDPDIATIANAKTAAQNASYLDMTQATATGEEAIVNSLKATAETAVNNGSVTVTINNVSYTAPIAGTDGNPSKTDGSYVFTITVSKGSQSQTTEQKTIGITATAYTGITDEQAVAAAKAALVDGLVNVAFGADQSIITTAVQAYVNGILGGTVDVAGVTATVTYNSATGKYEVALNKGSVSDSKSLTMMVTVTPAPDPVTPTPGPDTPAPAGSTQTTEPDTETKTITVVEVPQSIPNQELLTVEPVGEAFDTSVEVRMKEDRAAEGMVRTAMESVSSALNIENVQLFPMDISIYLKGTDTKVQPKEGTAVMITCPIPTEMLTSMDKMVVVCVIDGELQVLPSTLVTKDGVPCMQFTATHFSPYALVFDKDNNLADYAAGILPDVVTNISTKLTATAGTVTKVDLEGIKEGSTITYHVCTPTLISIDSSGNLFSKKAGNAILMANVTCGGATTIYTIRVTIKNAKGGTKVGFVQYYDDMLTYNNINYRITANATDTAEGTVAVANNQINNNLPKKVVIPATITYKGKTYKVTSIDESAFYNLNKITSVTIPSGVETISATAFVSCDSLKTFTVSSDNKYYSAKKGMLLNKEGTTLIAYPSAKGTIVIDNQIAVIGSYAFSACKYLTGIVIPKTVTRLEGCAFSHCKSLTNVTFQSVTIPEIPNLCVFDKMNKECTILVPETSLLQYQAAFQNARLPKGTRVDSKM